MKIFISQAGPRSKELAHALQGFIRLILPDADPWVSDNGIDKGTRSMAAISETLETAAAGIICLTPENLTQPWILFEAGALSRRQSDHVWTILLDVDFSQVEQPLGQFQHTGATKDDILKVCLSINRASPKPRLETDLVELFDGLWEKKLEPTITRLLKARPAVVPAKRDPAAINEEILEVVRELQRDAARNAAAMETALNYRAHDDANARLQRLFHSGMQAQMPTVSEANHYVYGLLFSEPLQGEPLRVRINRRRRRIRSLDSPRLPAWLAVGLVCSISLVENNALLRVTISKRHDSPDPTIDDYVDYARTPDEQLFFSDVRHG